MGILIKHSGNAASALTGAYGAGQGKAREDAGRQVLPQVLSAEEARKARVAAGMEAAKSREFAAGQADESRAFQADQGDIDRQFRSDEAATSRDFQANQSDLTNDRAIERDDLQSLRHRNDVEFGYSARQRAEFNNLSASYDEAVKSGNFTPDELKEVHRQVLLKQAGIKPTASLKPPSQWPEGQDVGQTWTSEDGNWLHTRDDKGNVSSKPNKFQVTNQDRIKAYDIAQRLKTPDASGKVQDPRPIKDIVAEMLGDPSASAETPVVDPNANLSEAEIQLKNVKADKLKSDIAGWKAEIASGNMNEGIDFFNKGKKGTSFLEKIVAAEKELKDLGVSPNEKADTAEPNALDSAIENADKLLGKKDENVSDKIRERKLKDGTTIRVRQLADGKWEEVQ